MQLPTCNFVIYLTKRVETDAKKKITQKQTFFPPEDISIHFFAIYEQTNRPIAISFTLCSSTNTSYFKIIEIPSKDTIKKIQKPKAY